MSPALTPHSRARVRHGVNAGDGGHADLGASGVRQAGAGLTVLVTVATALLLGYRLLGAG